ncbi:oligosaccharide repeat unit polymerase [Bacillus sp. S34]|nr:oligosaccharide repeat unit polymerase [Bacillus sp. S34]
MRTTQSNFFLGTVIFLILSLLMPFLLVRGLYNQVNIASLVMYLIILYSALRLSMIALSGKIKLIEMSFYIFVYIFFGIVPLVQVTENMYYWPGIYNNSQQLLAGLIIMSGIIAYDIGGLIGSKETNQTKQEVINIDYMKVFWLSISSICICIVSIMLLGGFSTLFSTREQLTQAVEGPTATIFISLMRIPIFIALTISLIYLKNSNNKHVLLKGNIPIYFSIGILIVFNLLVSNPLSTARFWFGTIAFTYLYFFVKKNTISMSKLIIIVITSIMIIFPYADFFRYGSGQNIELKNVFVSGDFDAFQQLMNTQNYVKENGLKYGTQTLGTALFFVPRSIWPEKPQGTGEIVAESAGYTYTNLSAPIFAEFYIDFGIIGGAILFCIYGYISAKLQHKYLKTLKNKSINFFGLFVPILAAYQFFLLRGQFLSTAPALLLIILFIKISLILIKRDERDIKNKCISSK